MFSESYQYFSFLDDDLHSNGMTSHGLLQAVSVEPDEAFSIDECPADGNMISSWLGCLIREDEQHGPLRLAQFPVKEFLLSELSLMFNAAVRKYLVQPADEAWVAESCIGYITHPTFAIESTQRLFRENPEDFQEGFPFYSYAASVLIDHLYFISTLEDRTGISTSCLFETPTCAAFNLWQYYVACKCGDKEVARGYFPTPLSLACAVGLEDVVQQLINDGTQVNDAAFRQSLIVTALCGYCGRYSGHYGNERTELITVYEGCSVIPLPTDRKALAGPRAKIVQILIEHGADVNYSLTVFFGNDDLNSKIPVSALFAAIGTLNTDACCLLLSSGSSVDWITDELLRNCRHNCKALDCLRAVLARVPNGPLQAIADLWAKSCSKCSWNFSHPDYAVSTAQQKLIGACQGGDWGVVRELLVGPSVVYINQVEHDGTSAIYFASVAGSQYLKFMLEHGGDPNVQAQDARIPLHHASGMGLVDNVELLLRYGADVDATDQRGWTALHCAAVTEQIHVMEQLLGAGAELNFAAVDGMSAL